MAQLTPLEVEKIQIAQKNQQDLDQLKLQAGDLLTSLELVKTQTVQKQLEVSKESNDLKNQLEAKYGKNFSILEDYTILTPEELKELQEKEAAKQSDPVEGPVNNPNSTKEPVVESLEAEVVTE